MEQIEEKAIQWMEERASENPRVHWDVHDVRDAFIAGAKLNSILPKPDIHFYDEENKKWVWGYSTELIKSVLK